MALCYSSYRKLTQQTASSDSGKGSNRPRSLGSGAAKPGQKVPWPCFCPCATLPDVHFIQNPSHPPLTGSLIRRKDLQMSPLLPYPRVSLQERSPDKNTQIQSALGGDCTSTRQPPNRSAAYLPGQGAPSLLPASKVPCSRHPLCLFHQRNKAEEKQTQPWKSGSVHSSLQSPNRGGEGG